MEVRADKRKVRRYVDHSGKKVNRLTFLRYDSTDNSGGARWTVRCECGIEFITDAHNILRGATKSCGCLRTEANKKKRKRKENQESINQ